MGVQVITRVNGINTSFNSAASNASGVHRRRLPEGNYFAFTTVGGGNFVNDSTTTSRARSFATRWWLVASRFR